MRELLLSSTIDAVTVYRTGALVRRVATIPDVAGARIDRLRIVGLPLALDDGSCRVSIEGDADLRAVELRIGLDPIAGASEEIPPDEAAVEAARAAEAVIRMRLERVRAQRAQLARLTIEPRQRVEHQLPGPSPTEARLAFAAMRRDESARLDASIAELAEALVDASRVRNDLDDRLARATNARDARPNELRKSVTIGVVGTPTPDARIVLDYAVSGARWVPSYVLRLDRAMRSAELAMRASVAQRTGEDWSSVRMTLSTALPTTWAELPKLPSLRVGRARPSPATRGYRDAPIGAESLFADFDRSFGSPAPAARAKSATSYGAAPSPPAPKALVDLAADAAPMPPVPTFASMPRSAAPVPGGMPAPAPMPVGAVPPPGAVPLAPQARARTAVVAQAAMPPAPPPEPASIEPEGAMLDYGRLAIAGPRDRRRGKPLPLDARERFRALLSTTNVAVDVDVVALVDVAARAASSVAELALPSGHVAPTSVDGCDYAYVGESRVDVASDGAFHAIPVLVRTTPASPRYVTVPRIAREAFRTVRFEAPLPGPILEGPVDVYVGADFLVTSRLAFAPTKGRVELGLGVEQAIKVARNTDYREETQGLLRGSLALAHAIRIEVANGLPDAATVEVRERLPVPDPTEDELTVELTRAEPKGEPWQEPDRPLLGGRSFVLEIPANAKRTVAIDYEVKLPSKRELVGGNRREGA